jgi:acetyl esterase/lipase
MAWSDEIRAKTRCELDVAYGPDERQKLDVYLPGPDTPGMPDTGGDTEVETTGGGVPILMFMHGGYWVIGHKDLLGFMAPALTQAPAILVSAGYRLAPGAKYPQQVDDCRAALKWVYENIARYGGDPQRLFVGGHSAGGHLAAMIALQTGALEALGLPGGVIKGCFPVSGVFDVTDAPPERQEAFLSSPGHAREASPLYNVEGNTTPFLLEIGEDDFPNLRSQHVEMMRSLHSQAGYVEEMERQGHNHFLISLDHADPKSPWTARVRQWMTLPPG